MTDFQLERTESPKKGFDWKYWLQNLLLGGIGCIASLCLHEMQLQREFRVGAELKFTRIEERLAEISVTTGTSQKRGENNFNDISTLWALVPGTKRFTRSFQR
jgi:hypothetical protein